jgi:hypothetical protein
MPHLRRAIYAFFMSVLAVGVLMVTDMIVSLGIGDFIFSPMFFIPMFVAAYLVAPVVAKHIRFH